MPAKSKSQQRLFGMVHAYNKGELHGSRALKKRIAELAKHISDEDARHFAETPHEDLPEKKAEGYEPPYNAEQMEAHGYRKELIKKLIKDKVHGWRMQTGVELIHKEPDLQEFDRIWKNWNLMTPEQKILSDKKSIELFGVDNKTNRALLRPLYEKKAQQQYTVAKGDNLSSLGKRYGVTADAIASASGIKNKDKIRIGQKITIPRATKAQTSNKVIQQPTQRVSTPPVQSAVGQNKSPANGLNSVSASLHNAFGNSNLEAAVLANIDRETGGTFNYQQWQGNKKQVFDPNVKQTGGYGLFQLTGPNLTNYKNYLNNNKLTDSVDSQVGFMRDVYGPSRAGWKKNTAQGAGLTREQYADWWHRRVETPAHVIKSNPGYSEKRIQDATNRHNNFMKNRIRNVNGVWVSS